MEFLRVLFPTRRRVFINGAPNGHTGDLIRVQAGTQRIHLGSPKDYEPPAHILPVHGTSLATPLNVAFTPALVAATGLAPAGLGVKTIGRKAATTRAPRRAAAAGAPEPARHVIYAHGIGNKPLASVLKCQWDHALFGFDLGERSRLAYWVNRERYPTPDPGTCSGGDLTAGDADQAGPRAAALGDEEAIDAVIHRITADKREQRILQKIAQHTSRTTPPRAQGPTAKVLPLPPALRRGITRRLTRVFLQDVYDLLFDAARRRVMLQSFRDRLAVGGGPFVVVGHSLGSVVAYLAMAPIDAGLARVPLFVTIGSPLGLAEVQDQLKVLLGVKTLLTPPMVGRWLNVADRLDPVALDANLRGDFTGLAIEDERVTNRDSPRHPHSATGYLRTESVRLAVRDCVDVPLFQPVGDFVVARDVARALEDGVADDRHDLLIELAALGDATRTLEEVRQDVVTGITCLRDQAGLSDDVYEVEALERFVSVKLTRAETELLAAGLGGREAALAIRRVWKNLQKRAFIATSINTLQVRPAHNAYRAFGKDIAWAVLDSGVNAAHPHFAGNRTDRLPVISATFDCTARGTLAHGPAPDRHGHGTHVAGIITGRHEVNDELISGMAPEARLYVYKVLDDGGFGRDSWIIKALDHVARTNEEAGRLVIHGVNLSLGGPFDPSTYACGHSPLCRELQRLWRQGVLVVIAAGNEGYAVMQSDDGEIQVSLPLTIGDPANLEDGITVGSVHKESPHIYGGSYFSSRGPTADGRLKPDVVAPGERILSCRHAPVGRKTSVQELYVEMSGTSMAAPHISGLLAAFLSIHREFIGYPDKVKTQLLASCTDLGRDRYQQGAGMPNLVRMLVGI